MRRLGHGADMVDCRGSFGPGLGCMQPKQLTSETKGGEYPMRRLRSIAITLLYISLMVIVYIPGVPGLAPAHRVSFWISEMAVFFIVGACVGGKSGASRTFLMLSAVVLVAVLLVTTSVSSVVRLISEASWAMITCWALVGLIAYWALGVNKDSLQSHV